VLYSAKKYYFNPPALPLTTSVTNWMIFLAVYSAVSAKPAAGRKSVALEGKRQDTDAGNFET